MAHLNKPKVIDFAIRGLTHGMYAVVAVLDNGTENKLGVHRSIKSAKKSLENIKTFLP